MKPPTERKRDAMRSLAVMRYEIVVIDQKYSGSFGFQDPIHGHFGLHVPFNRFQKFDHVMENFNEHADGLVPLHPLC